MTAGRRPKKQVEIGTVLQTFDDFLTGEGAEKRYVVMYGGAGSGKSYAVAQRFVEMFRDHEDLQMLAVCKTGPQLRGTAYKFIQDVLKQWGVKHEHNKTHKEFTRGDNTIYCRALDDPDKAKSMNLNHVWMEEATNFTIDDFGELDRRLRRAHPKLPNQLYLTFNPVDAFNWAVERFVTTTPIGAAVMHSTYKDNRFLPESTVEQLEALIHEDGNKYKIYTLGEPGVLEEGIYSNYMPLPDFLFPRGKPDCYGLDVGDTNPTAMVAIWRDGRRAYVRELLYQTRMSTGELIDWMKENKVDPGVVIYIDPSAAGLKRELQAAGFSVSGADHEVKGGIDYVRSLELLIDEDSHSLFKEIRSYSYKKDRGGHVFDQPVKFNDHLMDAMRYGIYTDGRALMAVSQPDSSYGGFGGEPVRELFGERDGRVDPYWGDL